MPKRTYEETKEDRWKRKLKKYEKKLRKKCRKTPSVCEDDLDWSDSSMLSLPKSTPSPCLEETGTKETPMAAPSLPATPLSTHAQPAPPEAPALVNPQVSAPSLPNDPIAIATSNDPVLTAPTTPVIDSAIDTPPADPELLLALGDFEGETTEWGQDINSELAKRWEPILRDGLKKEKKEELLKNYLLPKNCPLVKSPTLNLEIAAMLNESAKNRDTRILKKQDQVGCVLGIIGKTMTGMLTKSIDTSGILRHLTDATKLLADSHYLETETRRSLVTPMVDKTFIEPFKDRKRDSHLFGEKLGDFIKSSRGIQKTGKLIQSSSTSTNLNWKMPPSRQHQRNFRQSNRGGGGGAKSGAYRRRGVTRTSSSRATRASSPLPVTSATQRHKQMGAATSVAKPKT